MTPGLDNPKRLWVWAGQTGPKQEHVKAIAIIKLMILRNIQSLSVDFRNAFDGKLPLGSIPFGDWECQLVQFSD